MAQDDTKSEKDLKGTIDMDGLQAASLTQLVGELQLIVSGVTIIVRRRVFCVGTLLLNADSCDSTQLQADTEEDAQKFIDALQPLIGIGGPDENPLFKGPPMSISIASGNSCD